MESSPSSKLSFFNEAGATIDGPVEGVKCGIAIDVPKKLWSSISLKLNNVELPLQLVESAKRACSEWPACEPGHYELSLVCGDINERRTVTVMPLYFSDSEVSAILNDLTSALPKAIAAKLQECGALLDVNLAQDQEPSILQDFLKLRRALNGTKDRLGLLQLLPMIQRKTHQTLVPRHEVRETEKARRPDIAKLPQAISMPGNIASSGALNQMFDITVEGSFETYENRLVKAYIQAIQSQISRLKTRLQTEWAPPAVASELEALASELRLATTRASFLRQVRLPFLSADRVTMVLLKNPAYRVIWENYLALYKNTQTRLEEPALSAPLNNFPFLYQRWANFLVASVMVQVCSELGYQCISHPVVQKDTKGLFFKPVHDFDVALDLYSPLRGKACRLIPWRSERADRNPPSISQGLPPALAVAVYAPHQSPVVLVFDAKYRVAAAESVKKAVGKKTRAKTKTTRHKMAETLMDIQPMKSDVDELLACIEQLKAPGGGSEVQYAAILYPGPKKQFAPHLEALPARPLDTAALQKTIADVLRHYLG